jgi:hypothetical protein
MGARSEVFTTEGHGISRRPRKDTEYHGVYKGLDSILFFLGHG